GEILDGIGGGAVNEKDDHGTKCDLVGNAADPRIIVKNDRCGARRRRQVSRHVPLVRRVAAITFPTTWPRANRPRSIRTACSQRIGGAYWIPPLVHNLFNPRSILSVEPNPTFRSKDSP